MSEQTAVKKYSLVKCVTDGDGYEKGGIYPQVGDNNGVHILRETETGDVYDGVFQTGGIGKGLFNPWDNSGRPSFDPYYEGTKPTDQSAKADGGKIEITLVPMEMVEAAAVVRMYGNEKYPEGGADNWKDVSVERYRNALFRHLFQYLREPYGIDRESGLPHWYHVTCNVAFITYLDMMAGTLPRPEEALRKMHHPTPVQAPTSPGKGEGGYLFAAELKTAGNGAERGKNGKAD